MTTVKQEAPEAWYTLRILNKSGDERYAWTLGGTALLERPAGIEGAVVVTEDEARSKFNEIVGGLKFLAYTVPTDGSTGEDTREFNPEVDTVVTPQMQGG